MRTTFLVSVSGLLLVFGAAACSDSTDPRCQSCGDPLAQGPAGTGLVPGACDEGGCSNEDCRIAGCDEPRCDERSFSTLPVADRDYPEGHPCGTSADCQAELRT